MQPRLPQPFKLKLILTVIVVLTALVLWFIFIVLPFHIVGTNPGTGSVATETPFFNIEFNRTLSPQGLSLSGSSDSIASFSVQKKTLAINLNTPLKLGESYTITINSVQAIDGTKLTNKVFHFTAKSIAFANLPVDQRTAILKGQGQKQSVNNNPILAHLPHGDLNYNLTAEYVTVGSQTKLELNAQLLLSDADLSSTQSEQAAISEYKSEVTQYIISIGLNPSNYIINYQY